MQSTLTRLANFYKSDKGDSYKCAHHYTRYYEQLFSLPQFSDSFSLLEIGLNRDGSHDVPSLRMYRDFFKDKAVIYGADINPDFKKFSNEFNIFIVDQSRPDSLKSLKQNRYDLIIDDGSHASSHQQISLRELWASVAPGGFYVIEDLHWQPFQESCMKTVDLALNWLDGNWSTGQYLDQTWMDQFKETVKGLALLDSASRLYPKEATKNALLIIQKRLRTSWDCFDTLVTRRRFDPLTVFQEIEESLGLSNFTQRRKSAEARAPWSLNSIYDELSKDYKWSESEKEFYKNEEVKAELDHCCPIVENLRKVDDGDLVVSDMYLPKEAIEAILRKNGLNKNIEVFVSDAGKSSGTIWPKLPRIDLHIGDNYHSDVKSPKSYGIKAQHYTNVHPSELEKYVGGDLGLLMRLVRLANPYEPRSLLHIMWLEQSQLNIPSLILGALEIPTTNVSFIMRDCVHLMPIHEALHGTKNQEFHCSRIALLTGQDEWKKYVEEKARGRLLVDLHGTGRSILEYWQKTFDEVPSLFYLTGSLKVGKILAAYNNDAIEKFNSSPLGSLAEFPYRKPCEFDLNVLECQKNAVKCAISHIQHFKFAKNIELFHFLVKKMKDSVTAATNIHVNNHEPIPTLREII